VIRIASAPPSENAIVSAAGAKSPVFVSPVKVILGSDAVPAENTVGAVKVGLPDESSFGAKFARLRGIAMIKLLEFVPDKPQSLHLSRSLLRL
jgi:hypothetical protein